MEMDAKAAEMLMDAGISLIDPAPALAKRILSQRHFKAFLMATPMAKRKAAYDALTPHLAFTALPYSALIRISRTKRVKDPRHRISISPSA